MKKWMISLLCLGTVGFAAEEAPASSRNEDLKVILEKTFLNGQAEPLLNVIALSGIDESEKQIDADVLMGKFKESFAQEGIQAKFREPYQGVFSDAEIHELRKMHEHPVWQKYAQEGMAIFQAHMQTIKDTFKELALTYGTKKEEIASADQEEVVSADNIVQITQENYEEVVGEATQPLIIDVNASWCGPCKLMEPIIDELSNAYQDQIQFGKIDFDSQGELAKKYGVTALPTILFIKPGQNTPVMKHVGFLSKKDFQTKITEFLKK